MSFRCQAVVKSEFQKQFIILTPFTGKICMVLSQGKVIFGNGNLATFFEGWGFGGGG